MKFFIILCFFFIIGVSAKVSAQGYGRNEEPCSRAGGRCVLKKNCTKPTEESGLCPNQQENGYECCYDVQEIDTYYGYNEEPCSKAGGRCILKSECTQPSEESGLCPKQQENGYECCYGGPKSEYRCRKFGGECFKSPYCRKPNLNATDCGKGQECCILL